MLRGEKVIEFNNVTKIYKKTFTAVKDINIKIDKGEFIFIVGKSGAGKSTLINEILYKGVANKTNRLNRKIGKHKEIVGIENIDKAVA